MNTQLRAVAAAACMACAAIPIGSAFAQPVAGGSSSPYYIGLSETISHDSNVLRVNDGTAIPTGFSRSDNIFSTALLAGFDQPFGRQRGYANVSLRDNRYTDNKLFNNQGYSGTAGLDFSTIERIGGNLTATVSRGLQRYSSDEVGFLTDKNLETSGLVTGRLGIGMVTQWSVELNGNYRKSTNSLETPAVQSRDFTQRSAGFLLQYRPSSATTVGLGASRTDGRYPRYRTAANGEYIRDEFERNDIDFTLSLRPSGISSFDLRLSSGKTKYDVASGRNYSGLIGSAGWTYQPTGKLRFAANYNRDTGQDFYATTVGGQAASSDQSRVSNNFRFQTDYQATGKINVVGAVAFYDRKLVQTVGAPFGPLMQDGRDRTTVLSLGARWAPLRNVSVGCDYTNEKRRASGGLTADLSGSTFGCFGQVTLQ